MPTNARFTAFLGRWQSAVTLTAGRFFPMLGKIRFPDIGNIVLHHYPLTASLWPAAAPAVQILDMAQAAGVR